MTKTFPIAFCLLALLVTSCSKKELALKKLEKLGVSVTNESVFNAVGDKDLELLGHLKNAEAPLQEKNHLGQTALMLACIDRNPTLMDFFMEDIPGETLNAVDPDGFTALSYAITAHDFPAMKKLIAAGASTEVQAHHGESTIHYATRSGDLPMAQILAKGEHSEPALFRSLITASHMKRADMVTLLIAEGASPNQVDAAGDSPLALAVNSNAPDLVDALIAGGAELFVPMAYQPSAAGVIPDDHPAEVQPSESLLLTTSVKNRNAKIAQSLLAIGSDINETDDDGFTPLDHAVRLGDPQMADMLIKNKAELGASLFHAVDAGSAGLIDTLIAAGSDPNKKSEDGDTVLHVAVRNGDIPLAKTLLSKGAELTALGMEGQNPLTLAVALDKPEFVKFLIDAGADPNAPLEGDPNRSFLQHLNANNFIYQLRRDKGLTPVMLAASHGHYRTLKTLLENKAERYTRTKRWKTFPIQFACSASQIKCAQLLLGRDPENDGRDVRVTISLSRQRATCYIDGKAVTSSRISSGKRSTPTKPGNYVITDKHRHHRSSIYGSPMPYFMRFSCKDFGMHIGNLPGYPASHGCVRMPPSGARAFWNRCKVGDPVTIVR